MAMFSKKKKSDDQPKPWLIGRLNSRTRNANSGPRRTNSADPKVGKRSLLSTVLFVGLVVVTLSWVPFTRINCHTQDGLGDCQHVGEYGQTISETFSPWSRFVPFVNEERLNQVLLLDGRVDSVEAKKTWYNVLNVNIVERKAYAVWSSSFDGTSQYLLDQNGLVMGLVTDQTEDLADLPQIVDDIDLEPAIGEPLVESLVVRLSSRLLVDELVSGYRLVSVEVGDSPREFGVNFRATDGSRDRLEVLFTSARQLEKQVLDIEIAVDYFKEQGITASYLDVRLESSTPYR